LIIIDLVWFFQKDHRRLLDYLSGTYVVNESVVSASHDLQANSVESPPLEDRN